MVKFFNTEGFLNNSNGKRFSVICGNRGGGKRAYFINLINRVIVSELEEAFQNSNAGLIIEDGKITGIEVQH